MKKLVSGLVVLGVTFMAGCSGAVADDLLSGTRTDRVILDVRCSADGGCPTGFECEQEHATSYCKSHSSSSSTSASPSGSGACPPGFEQETEHEGTFCKPHGGGDGDSDDDGTVGSTGCTTDADCGSGLECELEHGVSFCKPHGSGKGSEGDD